MLSVIFNGVELSDYIGVLDSFHPFPGVNWDNTLSDRGNISGSDFVSRKYEYKKIKMPFDITGDVEEKAIALNAALNVKESKKLIFGSVPGKYVMAVPDGDVELEKTGEVIKGTITWLVPDGLMYSDVIKEYTASLNEDGVLETIIVNNGTESAEIDYDFQFGSSEDGYIGIVSDVGAMEFGNIEEVDVAQAEKSVTLINASNANELLSMFPRSSNTITTANHVINSGAYVRSESGYSWITNQSNAGVSGKFHGFGGRRNLSTPCKNFICRFKPVFATHKRYQQTGLLEIVIGDENGNLLCDMHIVKDVTGNNNGYLRFKIRGMGNEYNDVLRLTYEPRSDNGPTRIQSGECWIAKTGELFQLCWNGNVYSYRAPALANVNAASVNIFVGNYGNLSETVYYIGVQYLNFTQTHVQYTYDYPNRFRPYDHITIDGKKGKFYVNDSASMKDEVVGSDYFKAKPGATVINYTFSDFCENLPTVKARIRERWL